jgi:hypothetical protein
MCAYIQCPTWSSPVRIDSPDCDGVEIFTDVTGPRPEDLLVELYGSFDGVTFELARQEKTSMREITSRDKIEITNLRYSYLKVLCTPVSGTCLVLVTARVWQDKASGDQAQR